MYTLSNATVVWVKNAGIGCCSCSRVFLASIAFFVLASALGDVACRLCFRASRMTVPVD